MPDLCDEAHLGRVEGIRLRHLDLQLELSSRVRGLRWPSYFPLQLGPVVSDKFDLNATFDYLQGEGDRLIRERERGGGPPVDLLPDCS